MSNPAEAKRVFIGHKTADLLQCYLATYLLESHGIPCRVDEREKKEGMAHTAAEALELLTRARGHILIVSKHALNERRSGPRDGGNKNIRQELDMARQVYKKSDRPLEYKTAFVMDGVVVRDGLRGTWIEKAHGEDILKEPAFALDFTRRVRTLEDYESWKALIKSNDSDYRTSEESKLVSFFLREDEPLSDKGGIYSEASTLVDLDFLIRSMLPSPTPPPPPKPNIWIWPAMAIFLVAIVSAAWFSLRRPPPAPVLPPSLVEHEAEIEAGGLEIMSRGNASGKMTAHLPVGKAYEWNAAVSAGAFYDLEVVYANDSDPDELTVTVDGTPVVPITTRVTGNGGRGWNEFVSDRLPVGVLAAGRHTIVLSLASTKPDGVELDRLVLHPRSGK